MLKSKKLLWLCSSIYCSFFAPLVSAEESSRLETVVVTANRHETALQLAPASISVVDKEVLRLRNADDLADTLTSEVGVVITSVGQTRRGISIRGMPVEHTLYLVDGRRISSSNSVIAHSDFELSWLPSSAIERIEVVRGPMSSLYGADALGGVVNIITRNPGDEFHGEVSATATTLQKSGDGDTRKATFYIEGPLLQDKVAFTLGGEVFDRNSLPTSDDDSVSDIEGRESRQGQGKLMWTPDERQRLTLSYAISNDERSLDSQSHSGYYTSTDDIDRSQYGLTYQGDWQWGHLKLNAYQANLQRVNFRSNELEPRAPQEIDDSVVDGHVGMTVGNNHLVTVGGQFREETLKESRLVDRGKATAKHTNIFLQDEWQLIEPLMLVAGVAVDNHDEYDNQISPRLYAVYQLNNSITFKGGYGEGFRAPSLTELSVDYEVLAAGGRFWVEGNPDLEPESSKTYEAGIEYHDNDWTVVARVFENKLENLVQAVCYTDCNVRGSERRSYQNIDESIIRGLETELNYEVSNRISLGLNYTRLDTEDLGSNTPLEDRPEYIANFTFGWLPIEPMQLRWRSEYLGKQYAGTEGYAPEYHLHHLDVSIALGKNMTIYSGVENILDERLDDKSELYSGTEAGRELRLGITAAF